MRRGEIWWADLAEPQASEPGFRRPVLIVQADEFNLSRINTVVVVALTSNMRLAAAPGNVIIARSKSRLTKDSVANVSQILTLDKGYLIEEIGKLDSRIMQQVDDGLRLVLSL